MNAPAAVSASPADVAAAAAESGQPRLHVAAADTFTYAAWHNAVPLVQSLAIENPGPATAAPLVVEFSSTPAFARPKRWLVERLEPGAVAPLRDIDVEIDPAYLDRLDEAERGVLSFRLLAGSTPVADVTLSIRILARDEWGGMGSMAELLPAFVTPNDPALVPLLKAAADILGDSGHSTALDGYQSRDPGRAYLLAAALWSAVSAKGLTYANPPPSFETGGQKTRRVATVLADGLATCLDTTLLFAAGLEAVGLHSVIVMTSGHCFAGAWLIDKTLPRLVERDGSELRKAIAARELVVFETTLVTGRTAAPFPAAIAAAEDLLAEARDHEFVGAIDVRRGRMAQVRPLASHGEQARIADADRPAAAPPLPQPPAFPLSPAADGDAADEKPATPAGRIERWQRKLLDLSLRNRLLNFRATKQTVPVLCPDLARLEDRLADGGRLRLISLRAEIHVAHRDAALHQERTRTDLEAEFARAALEKNELGCVVDEDELDTRLTALFRKGKNDLAEGGSNTIYLAIGFLRWRPTPTDPRTYRAPLLLVPVQLVRRSAAAAFTLARHEDDVRFNATLLQLLKKDFGCDLTVLDSSLPTDDSGVDVPRILERMRQAVRDMPGFEVVEEAAIASFSFAKYLMWKDLVDRVGQLAHNRVVRHLVHEPDQAFVPAGKGPMPRAGDIDTRYTPADIVHPLPADSSQLAAVMAAAEGHDMVIVGPPGTGKSQTIANLIAQCLALGKTVLFVAEKTAALDVVHRRLREHGLGACCVELHSNKAERRRFLDQLQASWNRTQTADEGRWLDVCNRLCVRRDELNAYVAAAHAEHPHGWTVHRAMGLCVHERDTATPAVAWPAATQHDRDGYEALETAVADAAAACAALPAGAGIDRVHARDWSMTWEHSLVAACGDLEQSAAALNAALRAFTAVVGRPDITDGSAAHVASLYRLAQELTRSDVPPEAVLVRDDLDVLEAGLDRRQHLLGRRHDAQAGLAQAVRGFAQTLGLDAAADLAEAERRPLYRCASELVKGPLPPAELVFHPALDRFPALLSDRARLLGARDEAVAALEVRAFNRGLLARVPLDRLQQEWAQAARSVWPFSRFKRAAVTRKLRSFMTAAALPDPELDLTLLADLQACEERLAANLAALGLPPTLAQAIADSSTAFDGLLPDVRRIRAALEATGTTIESAARATGGRLDPLLAAAKSLFPAGRAVEAVRGELRENLAALGLSADLQADVEDTPDGLQAHVAAAQRLRQAVVGLDLGPDNAATMLRALAAAPAGRVRETAGTYGRAGKAFQTAWQGYAALAQAAPCAADAPQVIAAAREQARAVLGQQPRLRQWTAWEDARQRAAELGLGAFVAALRTGVVPTGAAVERFRLAYARWWLTAAVDRSPPLRAFQRFRHEAAIEDFRRLDAVARQAATARVLGGVHHGLPAGADVPRKSELGLLRHQMGLKRPSRSIREMIAAMPEAFGQLAPCLLMSPLSIAQYLPAEQPPFDVVVFDEASQIPTWDAIGAIARGRQTIIVGDPKQLPPTSFFGRTDDDAADDEIEEHDKDLESILDEAQAAGLPTVQLNWHYRSRHESLIAFSNRSYYGDQLVTFPAAEAEDRGVSLMVVEGAIYDRGHSRSNRREAEAIVADAVARMQQCLTRPEAERLTYGVVTFNGQQQALIQDLFDAALREAPELEWFFADERIEPTAVKNLENVQGDERDVMYFSITFGRDSSGKFPVDFGALNRDGGERRLNVAVTRARRALLVYASFLPDQLRAERSAARGVHDLKAFLEYAQRGPDAKDPRPEAAAAGGSTLERAVAAALESRGWQVVHEVGASGFRVDLGVVHPHRPGAYLAGIECDGSTYQRLAAARDRDKTREQVLANLGWQLFRVWAPDWWHDPAAAGDDLHARLTAALLKPGA